MDQGSSKKYVIIGAAAAGLGAINKLRMLDPQAEIICLTDEKENPYNKCLLADYMTDQPTSSKIIMMTADQALQKKVDLRLNTRVSAIIPEKKNVLLQSGQAIHYDVLLVATGSSPRKLAIKGIETKHGIFTFHTLRDIHTIKAYIKDHSVQQAVIIGAGLSGLECADALTQLNITVTVIEKSAHVLSTQLAMPAARVIESAIKAAHVELCTNNTVTQITSHNDYVTGVVLEDGRHICAQMVIVAAGLLPNSDIAQQAGITTQNGSILVNGYLQTNIADIYAAGDVILIKDPITGELVPSCTWPDAMMQGMIAACNMAGQNKSYTPQPIMTSSAFFGLKFAACGQVNPKNKHDWIVRSDEKTCSSYLISDTRGLQGFNVVGPRVDFGSLRRLVLTQEPTSIDYLYSL
jgi:NADPH-dependent 2,4-dienoyl-CoA reductase/sulfur reductase-like enzyme